jgi:Tfp pilus assembly protein PilP
MMDYKKAIRFGLSAALTLSAVSLAALNVAAQDKAEVKAEVKTVNEKSSGRDPFKKYQPVIKAPKGSATKLDPPSIQVRIERYRAQKAAAANAHVAAPKPTTALLLSEVQVTGIFRTPRGWSAMVEATPLTPKLSYVIYPGESFFDGQLVAIEESRLVFRRDIVWTDGRREKSVELKPLRAPSPTEAMTSAAAKASPADTSATAAAKPGTPEKQ